MSRTRPLGLGVIGVGFMGRVHLQAIAAAAAAGRPCRLAAVADRKPERLDGRPPVQGNLPAESDAAPLFDPEEVHCFTDPADLIADPAVEAVSVCTRTDTHVELTLAALAAGKHVIVEKPVAVDTAAIAGLRDAARASGLRVMPAMCMRFWPGWHWLLDAAATGRYGRVRSATFRRLGCRPDWAPGFYDDPARSGGALTDLHIHDADFIRALLGDPVAVSSTGSIDHLTTLYHYESSGLHAAAEGGWDHSPGFGFRMRYTVIFEDATAEFDLARDPPLLLSRGGEATPVDLPSGAGYDGEIRHFVDVLTGDESGLRVTLDDAVALGRLLDAERESLRTARTVSL